MMTPAIRHGRQFSNSKSKPRGRSIFLDFLPVAFIEPDFFWHTSCITFSVAKKFQSQISTSAAANPGAMNYRLPMLGSAAIGVPPRAKRVHAPRRRLPVAVFEEPVQPVKIVHLNQNLGTPVTPTQPTQVPCI